MTVDDVARGLCGRASKHFFLRHHCFFRLQLPSLGQRRLLWRRSFVQGNHLVLLLEFQKAGSKRDVDE